MNHVENIKKLFTKDFIESPLVESFEAGEIHVSSGKLIVCDPLITNDMPAFLTEFPSGQFPVLVHKERESNCVAYVEIVLVERKLRIGNLRFRKGSM